MRKGIMYRFFCLLGSLIFLLQNGYCNDYNERLQHLESRVDKIEQKNISGSVGGKHPSARGCPPNSGFFTKVDFLYWRAQNQNLPIAFIEKPPGFDIILDATIERMDFDWDPGFRIALGWNTGYDDWDVYANWTYYHNHSNRTITAENGTTNGGFGVIVLWLAIPSSFARGNFAKGTWRLNYNMIDLEWGRSFFVSRFLSLRPFVGGRVGWLYQFFRVRYAGSANPTNALSFVMNADNDFWGIGPRAGINTDWHLGLGFTTFFNLASALLYGKFKMHQTGTQTIPAGTVQRVADVKDDFYDIAPTLQMIIGFGWGSCFYQDKMFFHVKLGWEVNYWWNQNQFFVASEVNDNLISHASPFSLEGLTLDFKLDF